MAIVTNYCSEKPLRHQLGELRRYVRRDAIGEYYAWCTKQRFSSYDHSQGSCLGCDLPPKVRAAADAQRGQAFGYVDWPF